PAAGPPAELAARRRARLETGRPGAGAARSVSDLRSALAAIVGAEHVAEGEGGPAVSPGSLAELSQVVAHCHAAGVAVIPTDSRSPGLRASGSPALRVSLRRMARVLAYEPDDLTIGVEAGMSLAELKAVVGANGQQLPLEVADEGATLGALVAAAAEGPRRLGYGTMRDWALALTVVEPDGAVVRLGAQVVKNVTGYDLVKLYVGSRGTLGVIAAVSLRLFPRPPASATLVAGFGDRGAAMGILDDLAAPRLQPTACEYLEGVEGAVPGFILHPSSLILRAEGAPAAVARHVAELRAMAVARGAVAAAELGGDEEARLWRELAGLGAAEAAPGRAWIRLGVAPAELGAALGHAHAEAAARGVRLAASARGLTGVVYLLAQGPDEGLRGLFAALVERRRHAALLAAPPAVREGLPAWGAPPAALDLMDALKRAIDPFDCMCPGSYIV
ncbi:MAG TPA: FAD-binding oxidoreductase, partial [Chloroflexaceae bacterium]|nr:FAD-binding oxidoreductase [Chloroflexaceae bacterium]